MKRPSELAAEAGVSLDEFLDTPNLPLFDVKVRLVGEDGNAYAILGRVSHAITEAGYPQSLADRYVEEATSGDYDHLLRTTMKWVEQDEDYW